MSETKSFGGFLGENMGWTFNLVMAHIIFWWQGFTTVLDYGYSSSNYNTNGGIPSGGEGSGVFIITLLLMIVASLAYVSQCASYFKTSA